jgi:hypothetical protein
MPDFALLRRNGRSRSCERVLMAELELAARKPRFTQDGQGAFREMNRSPHFHLLIILDPRTAE